jgi:hypothetical protein
MPVKEPKPSTVKRLFALSQNCCAFPRCSTPIVEDSGTVTGIICHIKARSRGGPRYDAKQTPEQRHSFENLIVMCSRHSKIIDSEPRTYTVDLLSEMKQIHERDGSIELSQKDAAKAIRLLDEYRAIYIAPGSSVEIHAKTVHIAGRKAPKFAAPDGAIASSLAHRNYTKHLIDRYNEFASLQPGRTTFAFPAIFAKLKKLFGAKWDMIPVSSFERVVLYLQGRIDGTRQGRINTSKGYPNYSKFDEYQSKYGT